MTKTANLNQSTEKATAGNETTRNETGNVVKTISSPGKISETGNTVSGSKEWLEKTGLT